jgi:hypothetical protein
MLATCQGQVPGGAPRLSWTSPARGIRRKTVELEVVKETSLKPAIQQEVRKVRGSGSKRRKPTEEEIPVFRGFLGLFGKGWPSRQVQSLPLEVQVLSSAKPLPRYQADPELK